VFTQLKSQRIDAGIGWKKGTVVAYPRVVAQANTRFVAPNLFIGRKGPSADSKEVMEIAGF